MFLINDNKNVYKKAFTFALILVFSVMVLFSLYYISEHLIHECEGKDCHICMLMEQFSSNIKKLGVVSLTTLVVISLIAFIINVFSIYSIYKSKESLVSFKVRIDD
ncbi:MAG: hypothetical protein K6D02_03460 [Lachnospiraceae bacterium]|nr:hypothetical protein [Lachnospiraceae bacterium]